VVTLAQLTYSFDLSDADQWVASSFAGSVGPWTDEEAGTLVEAWDRIHTPVTPGQGHDSAEQYPCTECGHTTRDYVPGCPCCPL
jgi:hypothetical protein